MSNFSSLGELHRPRAGCLRIYYRIRCDILSNSNAVSVFQTSTQPSTTYLSDNININMDVILVVLQTAVILLLVSLPTVHGCSCAPQLNTATQRANDIINTKSINLIVMHALSMKQHTLM